MPKESLDNRRKRGGIKKGTALDSISRRERLDLGFPVRDTKTGKVTVRRKGKNGIRLTRGGGLVQDAMERALAGAKKALQYGKEHAPKPEKQSGKVSPEHKASDTRKGMGVLKRKRK